MILFMHFGHVFVELPQCRPTSLSHVCNVHCQRKWNLRTLQVRFPCSACFSCATQVVYSFSGHLLDDLYEVLHSHDTPACFWHGHFDSHRTSLCNFSYQCITNIKSTALSHCRNQLQTIPESFTAFHLLQAESHHMPHCMILLTHVRTY